MSAITPTASTTAATPELLTVHETADYLRIPRPTVYYLLQRGQLPGIQIGGRWRVKRSLLDRDILHSQAETTPHILCYCPDPPQHQLWKAAFKSHRNLTAVQVDTIGNFLLTLTSSKSAAPHLIILPENPCMPLGDAIQSIRIAAPTVPIAIVTSYPENLTSVLTEHGPLTLLAPIQDPESATALLKHFNLVTAE